MDKLREFTVVVELGRFQAWSQVVDFHRRRHDTQQNDIQHNDIQHNNIQLNDIQHNGIQHNNTQYNDTLHYNKKIDTQNNGTQLNGTRQCYPECYYAEGHNYAHHAQGQRVVILIVV
jgi:hypothetical protein